MAKFVFPDEIISEFCRKNHILKLSLLGPAADSGPEYPLDLIVEFVPETIPGFLRLAEMETEISQQLKRKITLTTPFDFTRSSLTQALKTSEVLYARE
jgi:uncharacterized protein